MEASSNPGAPAVYEAIRAVQEELAKVGVAKGRENREQKYKFRGIDDVYAAASALMAKNGLVMIPRVTERTATERTAKSGNLMFQVVVAVEYDLVAAKDGSRHTVRTYGESMDSGDKATNKATSAAHKYALIQTFCIPTEGSDDADTETHEVQAAPTKARSAPTHWKDVVVHFGPENGKRLGQLDRDTLSWFTYTWEPRLAGNGKPLPEDAALRMVLDQIKARVEARQPKAAPNAAPEPARQPNAAPEPAPEGQYQEDLLNIGGEDIPF